MNETYEILLARPSPAGNLLLREMMAATYGRHEMPVMVDSRRTAPEVAAVTMGEIHRLFHAQRLIEEHIVQPIWRTLIYRQRFGFFRPHNRSPKPLARLKHSLTMLALGAGVKITSPVVESKGG